MIIGKKKELSLYKNISPRLAMGIDYILNFDPATPNGKYELDGRNVHVSISNTEYRNKEEISYEAHKNYIDIQYIVSGTEVMGYASIDDLEESVPYNAEKDILFYKGEGNFINLKAEEFYIVFPCDAHMPVKTCGKEGVRKVVVKVKLED